MSDRGGREGAERAEAERRSPDRPDRLERFLRLLVSGSLLLSAVYLLLVLGALVLVLTGIADVGGAAVRAPGGGGLALERAVPAAAVLLCGGAAALLLLRRSDVPVRGVPATVRDDVGRMAERWAQWLRREGDRTPRLHGVVLAAVLAGGVAVRLILLGQPIRYDEAVTFLEYASRPLPVVLAKYDLPNNHVFHSVLVRISTAVLGDAEWAIRLPAFLAGGLLLPATYLVGRGLFGRGAALLATAAVAGSPVLVLFSTNARGYSLVLLFSLLLVGLGTWLLREKSPGGWVLFSVVGALGLHTIPVMLYPLGAAALWIVATGAAAPRTRPARRLAAETLAGCAGAAGLAGLLYLPAIAGSGVDAVVANRFVAPAGAGEFLASVPGFVAEVAGEWTHGVPSGVSAVAVVGFLLAFTGRGSLRRSGPLLALATLGWCVLLLALTRKALYARVWLPALPAVLLVAGAGVARGVAWTGSRVREPAVCALAAATVALVGWSAATGAVVGWDLTGTFPQAGRVAAFLGPRLDRGDVVVTRTPSGAPLLYEFRRRGIPARHLGSPAPGAREVYVVVDRDAGQEPARVLPPGHPVWRTRGRPRRIARFAGTELYLLPRAAAEGR